MLRFADTKQPITLTPALRESQIAANVAASTGRAVEVIRQAMLINDTITPFTNEWFARYGIGRTKAHQLRLQGWR